jgi:DNA-binding SARP family transcriptional activator
MRGPGNGPGWPAAEPAVAHDLRFQLLGPVRAWRHGRELELGGRKQRAVLAALLLHIDRPISCDDVVEFVWGEAATPAASGIVHTYVRRLRAILDPDRRGWSRTGVLRSAAQGYQLRTDPGTIDAWRFRELVAGARAGLARHRFDHAQNMLCEALRLWTGRPLENLGDNAWQHPAVLSLEQERLTATLVLADTAFITGQIEESLPLLTTMERLAPFHEPLHARLIEAYRRIGRRADALLTFERIRRQLRDELGIGPGSELAAILRRVLDDDAHPGILV